MERSPRSPGNTSDVLSLARLWSRLDRHDKAIEGLASASPLAGGSLDYWKYYADLLIETRNWGKLRRISHEMRRRRGFHPEFQPVAHYLEGRAALGENRELSANQAFGRMLEWPFDSQGDPARGGDSTAPLEPTSVVVENPEPMEWNEARNTRVLVPTLSVCKANGRCG